MTDPLHLTGSKLGNYRLQRVLGRGSMGVVYLATDEALLRPTAVKVLTWSELTHDPEAWFLAEARHVARLNHPSVIQIYSVARHGPYCYIAMEYVEGVSADVMVARDGPIAAERATAVMLQLAAALELAHAAGLIHRDVKPGNVLLTQDGTAKLGDFGMAVSSSQRAPGSSERAGTPHYFAPEIWRGQSATVATDLYALGATFFYLLAGVPPFDGQTIDELSVAAQRQDLMVSAELAARVPEVCLRVVRRCMAKQPGDRYESARAVAWELRGVLRELETPSVAREPTGVGDTTPPTFGAPSSGWRARGFELEPFAELDPEAPPFRGPPFAALRDELAAQLAPPGSVLVLTGAAGSGRSTLARGVLAAGSVRGAYVELSPARSRAGTLLQRIARAFGAVASSTPTSRPELEGLLAALAHPPTQPGTPLIVVDGAAPTAEAAAALVMLAQAARSTRYFSLLAVGPGARIDAARLGPALVVPRLPAGETARYVESWLRATRTVGAPPLIISVDAALILGERAEGNLARLNALVRRMIASAGPVLTSWEAWSTANQDEGDARGRAVPAPRPAGWPLADALALINRGRRAADLPERPEPREA